MVLQGITIYLIVAGKFHPCSWYTMDQMKTLLSLLEISVVSLVVSGFFKYSWSFDFSTLQVRTSSSLRNHGWFTTFVSSFLDLH